MPKVLAGFSISGDAALRAGGPEGGGKWDYRIVLGARTDGPFVDRLIAAAGKSERLVFVGVRGDVNLQNDKGRAVLGATANDFGDRSYETAINAITERFGSMEKFYQAHPNVATMATEGGHGGAAERMTTHTAISQGLDQIERQQAQPSQAAPQPAQRKE